MKRNFFIRSLGVISGGLFLVPPGEVFATPEEFSRALAQTADDKDFWKKVREQFTFPDNFIYFNTGGIGAVPKPVLEMVEKVARETEHHPRPGHDLNKWKAIREAVAPLLGTEVKPDEIALTNTATEGINIILNGLMLKRGDEVITTTHEHVALLVPLLNHVRNSGIRIRHFRPDVLSGKAVIEQIAGMITRRTRLIFLSHVTCTTGQILPVAEIGKLAREKGILFAVDGAQAAGTMPVDVKSCYIDFYATCGHKWILGPKRTGILYVSRDRQELLKPTTVGAYSDLTHDLESGELTFHNTAERYEYGTQNESLFNGLETAALFIRAIGIEKIHAHNRFLAEKFYQGLLDIPGVENLSPTEEEYRSSMITFRIKNRDYHETANYLSGEKMMRVRQVPEAGVNAVRVSFHVCNQEFEVDRILEEIRRMC